MEIDLVAEMERTDGEAVSLYASVKRAHSKQSISKLVASVRRLQEQLAEKNAENGNPNKPEYQRLPVKRVLLQLSVDYTKSTPERFVHEGETYYCFGRQHLMDTL